jgi:hypothetical protein
MKILAYFFRHHKMRGLGRWFFVKVLFTGIMATWMLTSCLDNENVTPSILGDVYYTVRTTAQDTLYALGFRLYANAGMDSVSVISNSQPDQAIRLQPDPSDPFYFYLDPDETDFNPEIPTQDFYYFNVYFTDGGTATASDYLVEEFIYPVSSITIDFLVDTHSVLVAWAGTYGAAAYLIRILDEEGNPVYYSPAISAGSADYTVSKGDSGWMDGYSPENGSLLTFEIMAYQYEFENTSQLQSVSIAQQTVTWQE